ncbi:MAG TPA: bifunctional phosphoribosylaminoimidazolecarboxamide formyltransferase/IMP cyclohydrolase [Acidimicrobiales bacterium]|jgi:phosphoribosylaminoimidazolecarboxamide formyltransferase/IMP cyclohydrolase|nr:bifunctional phosphoribosylaminoimidazolecarboxamide formyltransferase/IMP cyclohydrolase [Acidimicrobiales bacterium]
MRALLSVYDKAGLVEFAQGLAGLGWELVSSGGTAAALTQAGVVCTPVEEVTGSPEMLGGRVKTLHPAIHGGILADRDRPEHLADLVAQNIAAIGLVVCNLYPFRSDPSIEMIDVGGPTMVRAAAKNHAHVGVIVDPGEYPAVLEELAREGLLGAATRRRLARAAFAHTAAYDAAIVAWLDGGTAGDTGDPLPSAIDLRLERAQELRYGENPHQHGARYRQLGTHSWWDDVVQYAGLPLSYLNLFDAAAAWQLVHDLGDRPAVAIIKHANPCGVAVAAELATAYRLAYECDEKSAFGGIVALNRPLDDATAAEMVAAAQADVVIAPGYGPGTVDALVGRRKNTRLLEAPAPGDEALHVRQISGGFLVQEPYRFAATRADWRVVTRLAPTEEQWADAELAWKLAGYTKSNAVVLVAGGQAVGIGAGQQSRVDAGEIAARKAGGRGKGGACATDAFYPFRDGLDVAAAAGVAVVIQPGGAQRDQELIDAADEQGIAMVLTGERQFRH